MTLTFEKAKWSKDDDGYWLHLLVKEWGLAQKFLAAMKTGKRYMAELKEYRAKRSLDAKVWIVGRERILAPRELHNDGGDETLLEKYVDWDAVVVSVLRHHEENVVALANLQEEYAAITDGLSAVDYGRDRVLRSADADSGMVDLLLQRASAEEKIKGLIREERQYKRAWEALTPEEQRILTEFFQRGRRSSQQAVDTLCELYGYERTKIWNMRKQALRRFKFMLVG